MTSDPLPWSAPQPATLKRADWLPAFEQLLQRVEQVPPLCSTCRWRSTKDRPLLCAAVRAGCTHFATGDRRDFGHLFDQGRREGARGEPARLAKLLAER